MFKKAVQQHPPGGYPTSEKQGVPGTHCSADAMGEWYVEPLSDARTTLAAFFNILAVGGGHDNKLGAGAARS
jgi:hypothetical protein